jgi:hypothetical protein
MDNPWDPINNQEPQGLDNDPVWNNTGLNRTGHLKFFKRVDTEKGPTTDMNGWASVYSGNSESNHSGFKSTRGGKQQLKTNKQELKEAQQKVNELLKQITSKDFKPDQLDCKELRRNLATIKKLTKTIV